MEAKKRIAKNNKGFTIAEFLVAFGIMGVIVTTVGYMMTTSSKTYSSLSTEAQLQSEAQLVANAISELAIDSFDAGNVMEADYTTKNDTGISDTSRLVLLSRTKTVNTRYYITLNRTKKELELYSQTYNASSKTYSSLDGPSLLGQYLDNFEVSLDRVKDENIISFKLVYTKNGKSYTGDYQVLMRNRAYSDPDTKEDTPEEAQLKALTLTPKLVYVDVINGVTTKYYKDSINTTPYSIVNGAGSIEFTAEPIYKGTPASRDSDWSLMNYDKSIFNLSADKGVKSNLTWTNVGRDVFINTPNTEFSVVASQGSIKKEARVRLRIVRKITWAGSTGISGWKSEYANEIYKGKQVPDTNNYANAGTSVTLIPTIDQSNVSTDLTWKLYHRNPQATNAEWQLCSNDALAKLSSAKTSGGRQSNTVVVGKNAQNLSDEFKVEVISDFDDSVKAAYIFGILPTKKQSSNGDNSRGFKLNFNDWASDVTRGGYTDDHTAPDNDGQRKVKKVTRITGIKAVGPNNINDTAEGLKRFYHPVANPDDGQGYIYVDMNSFGFKIDQMEQFYLHDNMYLEVFFDYEYDVLNPNTHQPTGETKIANGFMRYHIHPVEMQPLVPTTICLQKGQSTEIDTQMKYYNVTKRSEWGIYVNSYTKSGSKWSRSSNLNRAGMEGTNQYLSFADKSAYGNADNYVDQISCQMEAKNTTKQYPTDALYVRITSEDYYSFRKNNNIGNNGQDDGKAYRDYKVYIANVEGLGVYLPGPNSTYGNFPSNITATSAETGVTIKGVDTTGKEVSAVVYKSGNKYKCVYGPNTYTYNSTYEYWKK